MKDGPNFLYRHFDCNGTLLYVGISLNAINRTYAHIKTCEWTELIANISVHPYSTREDALEAEKIAIANEKPQFNIYHNGQRCVKEKKQKEKHVKIEKPEQVYSSLGAAIKFFGSKYKIAKLLNIQASSVGRWKKNQIPMDRAYSLHVKSGGKFMFDPSEYS
jgi:excinuclease UvrABC nuclease subunit